MLNIAVVESDVAHANFFHHLLEQIAENYIPCKITTYFDSADFLAILSHEECCPFHLLFIDTDAAPVDGISAARHLLRYASRPVIVLISNSITNALAGYTVNAYRYLLKPLTSDAVLSCVSYASNRLKGEFYLLKRHGAAECIAFRDILYIESARNYVEFHTAQDTYRVKDSLLNVANRCPFEFVHCHRSYIINLLHLQKIEGRQITLDDGTRFSVSVKSCALLTQRLIKFQIMK